MNIEAFEVYPILHRGRIYNIITELDLPFVEVRAMIDWLAGKGAFPKGTVEVLPTKQVELLPPEDGAEEGGLDDASDEDAPGLFTCALPGVTLEVDVRDFDIVVYRRIERRV